VRPVVLARVFVILAAAALSIVGAGARASDQAPILETKVVLGKVAGRIDHLGVDLSRKRLLVAELGNNSLAVIDLSQDVLFKRISGLREPQGVAYAPKGDLIYVANARDGAVDLFRGDDLTPAGKVNLGSDADNIRSDGPDRMIVGYGDGALAVLDAVTGKKLSEVGLSAHPESFQLDPAANRIYVNVPEAHRIAVVDRGTGNEIARWGSADASANFPMALDTVGSRLFVGYRSPATLAAFDTRTGKLIGRTASCGDADDIFYDEKRKRVYMSCGEGFLAVFDASGVGLAEIARTPTQSGARTALFVPEIDRLFLAVRMHGIDPAAIWVFRLAPPPLL
jgi:DNA-binding beta-propeller fold protein YncE